MKKTGTVGIVVVVLAVILLFTSIGTVSAGQQGVKTRLGRVVGVVSPGVYFKLPFLDSVHKIDVKTRTINYDKGGDNGDNKATDTNLFGASKDLQDVTIGVVVTYHINPAQVQNIFTQYSSTENYESNVIEPAIREIVKSTSAQYTAEELVTKRSEFSEKVNNVLTERFATKDAILETFSVTNFEFSKSFSDAIEAKVTATQNAEAAKNKLEQIKYEAEQTVTTAKAVAEAQKIQSDALQSSGGTSVVQLKAIEKWDGHLPTQMIPGQSLPFINVNSK